MIKTIFFAFGSVLILSVCANAQNVPPPPTPIAEKDVRENTTKMRSIELERIKRESQKNRRVESTKEREIRFAKIKKDFEDIQKLQDSIIKTYTTGKTINYPKISKAAANMRKNALRLDENLFGAKQKKEDKNKRSKNSKQKSVRDLIIELDNAIGKFIKSPIFQNTKVVDSEVSKKAQSELEEIMRLSNMLSLEADKMK